MIFNHFGSAADRLAIEAEGLHATPAGSIYPMTATGVINDATITRGDS
jgi:hypothetical protein